ncbi:MAG: ArnT family glycosyltransferase [Solirubrobacteraceae bacterium]
MWRAWPNRIRRPPVALALLLAVGALQSLAWTIAIPAFQGPDEDTHFAYVQHLAETGHLQSVSSGTGAVSTEEASALATLNLHPLIGNLSARPAWSTADLQLWRATEKGLSRDARANGSGPNPIASNPPLYYALMAVPYRIFTWLPLLKRLFVLRLAGSVFFLMTIAFTWLIAGEIFGAVRWKQTLAAGTVALEPQLAFMSATINADNLLVAVTTAFLLASLRIITRGPTLRRVLLASGLACAAMLTHGRGLVALPVLAVTLTVAVVRYRPPLRAVVQQNAAAIATVALAAIAYLTFWRPGGAGKSLYGGQVSELNGGGFNLRQFLSSIYQFYFPRLPSLQPRIGPEYGYRQVFIDTFYATFGSLEVTFRQRIYDILQVLSAVGLVGFYTACVTRWRSLLRSWPVVVVMLALLATTLFFLHYVSYQALLHNGGSDPLIVGRYLLPTVSLFGVAIAFTAAALPRRAAAMTGGLILSIGVLLSLGGIAIATARFYA